MKKYFYFIAGLLLIISACTNNSKRLPVTLFFDPSHSETTRYKITATLDEVPLMDTLIENNNINSSQLIKCFDIDTAKKNALKISVQGMTTLIDLAQYKHYKCADIFTYYDSHTKLRALFEQYEKQHSARNGKLPDYKKFLDSIKTTKPGNKFDSLYVGIDRDRCMCKK